MDLEEWDAVVGLKRFWLQSLSRSGPLEHAVADGHSDGDCAELEPGKEQHTDKVKPQL